MLIVGVIKRFVLGTLTPHPPFAFLLPLPRYPHRCEAERLKDARGDAV